MDKENNDIDESRPPPKVKPSDFMRVQRPECYSDSEDVVTHTFDRAVFDHSLETITHRNETHEFEIFCRKLCEYCICPNLRPHAGPDGGGDGKTDTDNYPVAEEIRLRSYIGHLNGDQKKTAFAFSAKKRWSEKVRSDVKGIIAIDYKFEHIYFVTSRSTRNKDRARIEKELQDQYGVPVTILDRLWIVDMVFENNRQDLAFNYLGVGAENPNREVGMGDFTKQRQLDDIEKEISDPSSFAGIEVQLVTEALAAAKLSRNLEKPEFETMGRFERAIRLAGKHGTRKQVLAANYERLWTRFWWFDDVEFICDEFEGFKNLIGNSTHAAELDLLCNIIQLLYNIAIHQLTDETKHKVRERSNLVEKLLDNVVLDTTRPNSALQAETSLIVIEQNKYLLNGKRDKLDDIWLKYLSILNRVEGLGEYPADRLIGMIEACAPLAGDSSEYTALIEQLSEFIAKRTSEGQAGLTLLKRAEGLSLDSHWEMIRLLGKSATRFIKKEYEDELIRSLQLLAIAYRKAGLLWASRACCMLTVGTMFIEAEGNSQLRPTIAPILKIWCWVALELGYIADLIQVLSLYQMVAHDPRWEEETSEKIKSDILELDFATGSFLLNVDETLLPNMGTLPDILDKTGMFFSRGALLYRLGHKERAREDGCIPPEVSDVEIHDMMVNAKNQPIKASLPSIVIDNVREPQSIHTCLLGMNLSVTPNKLTETSILAAEAVIGTMEAFFATSLEGRVMAHTESFLIEIIESEEVLAPTFEIDDTNMFGVVYWPLGCRPNSFTGNAQLSKNLLIMAGKLLGATCFIENFENLLEQLFEDAAVHDRVSIMPVMGNSYSRVFGRKHPTISDFIENTQEYEPLKNRPNIISEKPEDESFVESSQADLNLAFGEPPEGITNPDSHKRVGISSIIDVHSWNRAGWHGVGYASYGHDYPPIMFLLFRDKEAAKSIFLRWHDKFNQVDENEEISINILQGIDADNPNHYRVMITADSFSNNKKADKGKLISMVQRSLVMEPNDDLNLKRFIDDYQHHGSFLIAPAHHIDSEEPDVGMDMAIKKSKVNIKHAWELLTNDIAALALHPDDNILIPEGIKNPPVLEIMKFLKK